MIDRQILEDWKLTDEDLDPEVERIFSEQGGTEILDKEETVASFEIGGVKTGRVLHVSSSEILLDLSYKAEGVLSPGEFDDPGSVEVGDEVEVLIEAIEDDAGMLVVSKRKADRIRGWERLIENYKEGDVITGRGVKKIKGGLLVDVGVLVFLPASQVDLRRGGDIGRYIGQELTCKVIKIDPSRRNVVVSRRRLLEEDREKLKGKLLEEVAPGQLRKGVVKNIADFGVFVDLGGLDGLLHITDMSWGRIGHPSEIVKVDEDLEVVVLSVDRERERIALGLKQKTESPWENVAERYPPGTRIKGKVVNLVPYGAFVEIEEGIEGLVHVSEMSWTRRVNHPEEIVKPGQEIEVMVLKVDEEKQNVSLGIKQVEENPWEQVELKYPPGTQVDGIVRNLTNYGAFVEIEEGIDGLLHVSDMSWTKKVMHPKEIVEPGQSIEAVVLSVDKDKKRIALGIKQLQADPWDGDIPSKYPTGSVVKGTITKIANFGAFVELEPGLEGLLHTSEISEDHVEEPGDVLAEGQEVEVQVLRVDPENRRIGLSKRRVDEGPSA